MAIENYFGGATILKPGMYTRSRIKQVGGFPLLGASIVGIVGEAVGGAPGSTDGEGVQTYASTEMADLADKYISGPIVEAARALISPGRDSRIPGGANYIRIYKTNQSTQGSSTIQNISATSADLFDIDSINYGADENLIYYYVSEGTVEDTDAILTSGVITFPVTLVLGDELVIEVDGTDYTYTVAASAGVQANITALMAALNNAAEWSLSKPVIFTEGSVSDTLVATMDNANAALDEYNAMDEYSVFNRLLGSPVTTNLAYKCNFVDTVAFNGNGSALGTFTVAASTGLSAGQFVTIYDDDSPEIRALVTSVTGTAPTVTITVDNGLTNLTAYTTASNAAVYIQGSVVNLSTLAVSEGEAGPSRGYRGSRIITVGRNASIETLDENDVDTMLRIWYVGTGTACTMAISDVTGVRTLATTVTGGGGSEDLDIALGDYTIQELSDYINNFASGVYSAVAVYGNKAGQNSDVLDYYNAIDIYTMPLEVKAINWEILTIVNNQSEYINFELQTNIYGALETITSTLKEFLTTAVAGASTNSNFQDGFDALLQVRCNTIVPLVSQDATDDITDGVTDASSTYTIDSINLMTDTHCRTASNIVNRSERNGYVSFLDDDFEVCRQKAEDLNSEYTSFVIQESQGLDVDGNTVWQQPYMLACKCAGMQAGSEVGTPITYKQPNITGIRHDDFDPQTQYDKAIKSGILFVEEPDYGGFRVVVGNTTYGKDSNGTLNRISVMESAHYVSYNLRKQIEQIYVGRKMGSAEASGESIKTTVIAMMTSFKDAEIIVGDDTNDGLGYKNLSVRIDSNVIYIDVTITPVPGIDFVFGTIVIDTVKTNV